MDAYLHPALINGGIFLAPLAVPAPQDDGTNPPSDVIDASKVPASRTVVFEGSIRVINFEGSIRKVDFE